MANNMNNVMREVDAYNLIKREAGSNAVAQGVSGLIGFPATLAVDGAVIFTHYARMFGAIRELYNRQPMDFRVVIDLVPGLIKEIIFDIVGDKMLGNVPIIGIYFNAICAKTLTWRLGILFTMLASRGEEITREGVCDATRLIRAMFPQTEAFTFKEPAYEVYEELVRSVEGDSMNIFEEKIKAAMHAMGL